MGLSRQVKASYGAGQRFEVIWTTALWNVAELRGLLPRALRSLPICTYFHENQFDYPSRSAERDAALGWDVNLPLDNWTSCLASDAVWFNSAYNRDSLLRGASALLSRMPDENSLDTLLEIEQKARVVSPGIDAEAFGRGHRSPGPLNIAWVSRWEHDKRPDLFFKALSQLEALGCDFSLTCLGQNFKSGLGSVVAIQETFGEKIAHWGFVDARHDQARLLGQADVVVSTAEHEFFGIGILEAVAAGCIPCVPDRLVYPELYPRRCLYAADSDDTAVASLASRLRELSQEKAAFGSLQATYTQLSLGRIAAAYSWDKQAALLDDALVAVQRQACG